MKIAHFGTFDVDNYGDLLFPHIVEWRMPSVEWIHISPSRNVPKFSDALKRGREVCLSTVEKALYKKAVGYEFEETSTEVRIEPDGTTKPVSVKKTTIKKETHI